MWTSTPVSRGQTTETGRDPTNPRTISKEAVDEKTRASGPTNRAKLRRRNLKLLLKFYDVERRDHEVNERRTEAKSELK